MCGRHSALNISFSRRARKDLASIRDYISDFDEQRAEAVILRILQSIRMFDRFPLLGRPGRVEETREFVIPGLPYIVIYEIASETEIVILSIVHERMNYPDADD